MTQKVTKILAMIIIVISVLLNDIFMHFVGIDLCLNGAVFYKRFILEVVSIVGISTCLSFFFIVIPSKIFRK